jgi:hypothetical protein
MSNVEGTHFLLPSSLMQEVLLVPTSLPTERANIFAELLFSPPDPPPRRFVTILI